MTLTRSSSTGGWRHPAPHSGRIDQIQIKGNGDPVPLTALHTDQMLQV